MDDREAVPRHATDDEPRFARGSRTLAGFVLATAALLVGANAGRAWLLGADPSPAARTATTVAGTAALGVVALTVLRLDAVRLSAVGLSRDLVVPGTVAVGGFWACLNVAGVAFAALAGGGVSVGYVYDGPLGLLVVGALVQYLLVGPVEELAYRGYLQNALVDRLGGRDDRTRVVLGIGAMALVFAATHVPNRVLVDGASPASLPPGLAALFASGVLYGVVYEATGNLVLLGLLHGTFNRWLLLVDPRAWPPSLFAAWVAVGVVLLGATVWGYRRSTVGESTRSVQTTLVL